MSLASAWAAQVAVADEEMRNVEGAAPPSCAASNLSATVTRAGGLYLNREATLTADEALALGQWIMVTFG